MLCYAWSASALSGCQLVLFTARQVNGRGDQNGFIFVVVLVLIPGDYGDQGWSNKRGGDRYMMRSEQRKCYGLMMGAVESGFFMEDL